MNKEIKTDSKRLEEDAIMEQGGEKDAIKPLSHVEYDQLKEVSKEINKNVDKPGC